MSRARSRVVFLLLILILLVASLVLGLLVSWLGPHEPSGDQGGGGTSSTGGLAGRVEAPRAATPQERT